MPASLFPEMERSSGGLEDQRALQLALELSMLGLNNENDSLHPNFEADTRNKKSQNTTECVPVPSSEHVAEIVGRQGERLCCAPSLCYWASVSAKFAAVAAGSTRFVSLELCDSSPRALGSGIPAPFFESIPERELALFYIWSAGRCRRRLARRLRGVGQAACCNRSGFFFLSFFQYR